MIKYIVLFITIFSNSFLGFGQTDIDPNGYNVFYYENGQKSSEGNFLNGKPEGYWKNYFETGVLKSEGNRKNHELDSIWLFYYENGLLKEKVQFSNSIKQGLSYEYSEEGFLLAQYPYENDTINGVADFYFNDVNRVQFEKPYMAGVLEGVGYEYDRDGRIITILNYEKGVAKSMQFINRFNPKNLRTGLWIEYYEDITDKKVKQIEGRYKDDLKNGYFREYDKKGVQLSTTKYVNGEIVENAEELMNVDLVREYFPDASVKWEKTYLGSKPHGIWKEYDTAGVVVSSIIYNKGVRLGEGIVDKKGIKQGYWKEYYSEGELRGEGEYLDGGRIGKWKFYHENGKIEQVGKYRKGGKPHGDWVWYYENGEVRREETYSNGKEDGQIIEYDEEGNILKKGEYIAGLEEGDWEINTGDYIERGSYIEGMMHGEWEGIYKSTGKTAFKGNYIEGEPDGKHVFYYPNGKKMLEGRYQAGLKTGDWKRYNKDGLLTLTIRYKDGKTERLAGKKLKKYEDEEN